MKSTIFIFVLTFSFHAFAKDVKILKVLYTPVFRDPGEEDSVVGPLLVDETPVTNNDFLTFIQSHPEFARSKIPKLYADVGYLSHWNDDRSFAKEVAHFPVTNVSWFVARRCCASKGKRLSTIAEWEVLSEAQNPKLESKILSWYANPTVKLKSVGQESANKYGVKDTHGLIWEWVDNFSEAIMSGDSRGGSSTDALFCGGAALKAKDPTLYAAFMRFAYRGSLNAKYISPILGFRCVKDIKE